MITRKLVKATLLGLWAVILAVWLVYGIQSRAVGTLVSEPEAPEAAETSANQDDYVGSESCKACHEDQFKGFSKTKHSQLAQLEDWKDKATGCESCHGPGRAHIEEADPTKIISFKDKSPKQISENCLSCHAGKEDHNQFRRSEHYRNNIGCTDCHSAHGATNHPTQVGSITYPAIDSEDNPGTAMTKMLKVSEPQLCLSCHQQAKAQFSQPFHHKVLEGQMNCSDCHNSHGGFEVKNARLSVGADAVCVKCHTDKQGPFVYEHLPITVEGCATCHNTHGSTNPKMLKRNQVRQLCLECHTEILQPDLAPGVPSFHRQDEARTQNCTVCHVRIHGSNTHPAFFR
ncbi:MAG: cytochrome C [Acidobacteriota bacterium]|nr:MAG: cytochrome C [Acidobacteriota bacterium]